LSCWTPCSSPRLPQQRSREGIAQDIGDFRSRRGVAIIDISESRSPQIDISVSASRAEGRRKSVRMPAQAVRLAEIEASAMVATLAGWQAHRGAVTCIEVLGNPRSIITA
jgi:hypothetical protein